MSVREYIDDKSNTIMMHLIAAIALGAFLYLTGTKFGIISIIIIVWFIGLTTANTISFLKIRSHISELNSIMSELDKKYLFSECIPKPKSNYEKKLFQLVRKSGKSMIENVSESNHDKIEYREYIESWVHEIKTPITASKLIAENAHPDTGRKLKHELSNIENLVESTLFYARSFSAEKDFLIKQTSLNDIVEEAIDKHKFLIIQNNIHLNFNEINNTVYTDSKWAIFMLGQLLQNAVRYRSNSPTISISVKMDGDKTDLIVTDNGIGISSDELPRVFDRGFTGSNGRSHNNSTGMGLYLCKKLGHLLAVDIKIMSTLNKGTSVTITFPSKSNLSKM
ncbi:MAG: sensor histidine kinase [Suipraeoptans sp.]